MARWFSSGWEASWRPFQYFNLYRLLLAGLFALASAFPGIWVGQFHFSSTPFLFGVFVIYLSVVIGGLLLSVHWQSRFNLQLTAQISLDVAVVGVLMHLAGGVSSGLGVVLLVSLAAASLVGRGRLVLLYAALGTLTVLAQQIFGIWEDRFEYASIVQAGLLSAAFFATAILARLLGQRVMANEDLARRRGIALENQILISRRVVERMQDGILVIGADGMINRCNPMAVKMLGLPKEGGGPLVAAVNGSQLGAALAQWRDHSSLDAFRFAGAEGADLCARFERTDSSDGEVLVFLEDFGRIKEHAQQLKLASLGRLTASIAHEIRNPLSAIGYAGELLREERRGDVQDRLLKIVKDNVVRLDRIVADVLELGRQTRAQAEILNLKGVCSEFVELFCQSEGVPEGVICWEIEDTSEICFDRAHLHQVLWNLVSNALRYSSRLSGAVRLSVSGVRTAVGRVELHIQDDGPGIPETIRGQVFEPFFTTSHQGTGLGLFIAKELCAINGAQLDLLPSEHGAHFLISGRNDTCQMSLASGERVAN